MSGRCQICNTTIEPTEVWDFIGNCMLFTEDICNDCECHYNELIEIYHEEDEQHEDEDEYPQDEEQQEIQ